VLHVLGRIGCRRPCALVYSAAVHPRHVPCRARCRAGRRRAGPRELPRRRVPQTATQQGIRRGSVHPFSFTLLPPSELHGGLRDVLLQCILIGSVSFPIHPQILV
jgi:hypothetical protein